MSTTFEAILTSWPPHPWLALSLILAALVYFRGWRILRRHDAIRWNWLKLTAFLAGFSALYLALASPIEVLASLVLRAHMVQHLMLMMVVPPLLWLAEPQLPLLWGLPKEVRRHWALPLVHWSVLRKFAATISHPFVAGILFVLTTWLWHLPWPYQAALEDANWHKVQHLSFLLAGLVFWYPVVRPFPARPSWSPWLLIPYLLLADVQNTLLSAWFTFADQPLYAYYESMPRLGGVTALDDQAAAGVIMWIPGSLVFLGPLVWIGVRTMTGQWRQGVSNSEGGIRKAEGAGRNIEFGRRKAEGGTRNCAVQAWANFATASESAAGLEREPKEKHALETIPPSEFRIPPSLDLLRIPLLGRILQSIHFRRVVQFVVLLIAIAVIVDGLWGPQIAPMNLAGVLPWIHWRALLVIGLLAIGNVFCYGCPFMLPRNLARRLLRGGFGLRWPRPLRSKWLAVVLVAVFVWAYESLGLWDSPSATAWIAIGYFVGAILVDSIFRDATFCKYVCPIGQFNFIQSFVSPFEVKVREPAVCSSCRTHDCLRGRSVQSTLQPSTFVALPLVGTGSSNSIVTLPGCELKLFQPRKVGNLDCTFCLDCVQACPHDNVGMIAVGPMKRGALEQFRSGIGRLSSRLDYAALAMLLVFGAFANAAGMTAPVVGLEERLSNWLGNSSRLVATTMFFLLALFALPAISMVGAAASYKAIGYRRGSTRETLCRFAWALVPLGFAMWMAHYLFHFVTSYESIVPVSQRFFSEFGHLNLGSPNWVCACCQAAPDWLLKLELVVLDVGLLASLYLAWRIDCDFAGESEIGILPRVKRLLPWSVIIISLFAIGVWILLQPMQMRGTLAG